MILLRFFYIILLTAITMAAAAATPTAATISYNLLRNGTPIGVINEHFEIKNGAYSASSEATATGLFALAQRRPITYTSTGEATKDGLRPLRFEGRRNNSLSTADFDWKSDKLTMSHDGVNQTVALPAATQDRLSAMYQFMHLVQQGQSKSRATGIVEMPMTTGRKLDHYRYDTHTNVVIETPLKRLTTLHLAKQRDQNDSHTEIWLAPEFHYLPVKVLIVESDGVRYEQIVTRLDVKL
jgi:hypothetical protein